MSLGAAPTPQQLRSWRGHPLTAAGIRVAAFATPILAAIAVSTVLSRLVPVPRPLLGRGLWWVGLLGVSTVVLVLADRAARTLLPLAALLKLSLVFPDQVPSRFSVALRTGTTKQLARRLAEQPGDEATRAGASDLLALVAALNHHDRFTRGHAERVRALTDLLAAQLQLEAEDREKLRWVALLHDIGKLSVPGEILRKSGKPTAEEWEILRTHPAEGLKLVRGPIADWLGDWTSGIGEHHEQFDGSGYPNGLSGHDISYAGRLVAVTDVFDVITAVRSYKKPMTIQEARLELTRCAGTQFDPAVVRAFLQISIGDLRKAMGPLAWVAQLSIFGQMAAAPAASTVAGGVMALGGIGLGPVSAAEVAPAAVDAAVEQAATGAAGTDASTSDGTGPTAPGGDTSVPTGPLATTTTTVGSVTTTTTVPSVTVPGTPPITVPGITLPPITVPGIPLLPPITLPPITVPGIPLPPITLPPITLPPITLPPITVPGIPLPPLSLPSVGDDAQGDR